MADSLQAFRDPHDRQSEGGLAEPMPELPEIVWRAREVHEHLRGRRIVRTEVFQPKCLNIPADEFRRRLQGEEFQEATYRGKWVVARLREHDLLLNLGMGGELLLHGDADDLPPKLQALITLHDGARLSLHFVWFGYLHLVPHDGRETHGMTGNLGMDPLASGFTTESLGRMLASSRTRLKALLLDQTKIAGIGNMYAHDILFRARLHPNRKANTLSPGEVAALVLGLRDTLELAIALGGSRWEKGLLGQPGGFDMPHLLVGYKESQPCPACGAAILKIRTGSTASFICPECQRE